MNGWAESTPISQHSPISDFSQRAVAFGMRSIEVDGQDVEAVYNATREAREHAVSGQGPVFLNVRTYRLVGHYIGDPQVYREKSELEDLRETRDPVTLLRTRLGIGDEEFEALDTETEALIEAAVEFAKAGTDPRPEDALKYVYA
jgi:pyruvate dehydrogenase E1 component alpha subunit